MYPSGVWRGFWEQSIYGRQPMADFHLKFRDGTVDGYGIDLIGRFLFYGQYNPDTGRVRMVKRYLGKHEVLYVGVPDGEGSITGTWSIVESMDDDMWSFEKPPPVVTWSGPFLLQPVLGRPTGEEPILEVTK
jgi:hypothetical protein